MDDIFVPVAPLTSHQVARLLLQLALILSLARLLAELARRLGQPAVLGELVAGLVLGPTIFGTIAPGLSDAIFPQREIAFKILEAISWVGMVLLLFLIGAEIDIRALRRLGKATATVAVVGLAVPFVSGLGLGAIVPDALIPATTSRALVAALLATALAISAMPVIAKILFDLGLARRDVGIVILGASVFDDTVGWMVLAVIARLAEPTGEPVAWNVGRTVVFLVSFLAAARYVIFPLLKRATRCVDDHFQSPGSDVALYASLAFALAALTDKLGIHAVFGAFTAGALIRQVPRVRQVALERLEAVVGSVLAPVFFAFVGLKVNLVRTPSPWLIVLVLVVAIASKILGCYIGGRLGGLSSRASLVVGAGMSARGAMGLVLAVVGLSLGVLSPTLYTVLVVMAIGTSLVAPILLRVFARGLPLGADERLRFEDEASRSVLDLRAPKVLVPTAGGPNAAAAVEIAASLCRGDGATLTVLHVERPGECREEIAGHLDAMRRVAERGGRSPSVQRVSNDDVVGTVLREAKGKDILMLGASNQERAIYRPPVESMVREAPCHAVVVSARGESHADGFRKLVVPVDGSLFARVALEFAVAYARAAGAEVSIVHVMSPRFADILRAGPLPAEEVFTSDADRVRATLKANLARVLAAAPKTVAIHVVRGQDPTDAVLEHAMAEGYDLLVVGAQSRAVGSYLFLGHGTERLVESASCSTALVIPRL